MLVFFTGRTRSSAEILSRQQAHIDTTREELDQIKAYVSEANELLRNGDLNTFGELLDRSWQQKKALAAGVSDPEIDELYERARDAGALGGKIAGAGGGGFVMLYTPPSRQDDVREALTDLRELPIAFESNGSKVVFNIHG